MKMTFSFKLGAGVVLFFSLLLSGLLMWTPVRARYYLSWLDSDDIKKQVSAIDGLFTVGKKGLEMLVKKFPEGPHAARLLINGWEKHDPACDSYHREMKDSELLQVSFRKYNLALKLLLAKKGYTGEEAADRFYNIGIEAGRGSDYATAIAYYNIAILLKPDYRSAYNNRGIRRDDLKDYIGAIKDYDIAIKLDPKYVKAFNNRGYSKRNLNDIDGAIEDYRRALELDPKYITAIQNLGEAYLVKEDLANAITCYKKRIELQPGNALTFRYCGYAQFDLGRFGDALLSFNNAFMLEDPTSYQRDYSKFRILLIRMNTDNISDIREEAKRYLKEIDTPQGVWNIDVARFFAGELDEEGILKLAETDEGRTVAQQKCEAYYYCAEFRLARGDIEGAIDFFKKCMATEVTNYTEYRSSKWRLRRLQETARDNAQAKEADSGK